MNRADFMYTAHKRKGDGEIQSVYSHSNGVRMLAEQYSADLKFPNVMRLAAMLHDAGKMNEDFGKYIQGDTRFSRGSIDHCYAGAKYIAELSRNGEGKASDAALFIARVIISHHGLNDWVDGKYKDYLKYRILKDERYGEICEGIKTIAETEEFADILKAAENEYVQIEKRIRSFSVTKENKSDSVRYTFYMGLFERLAESVLIDADRTDTAEFMDGIKPREFQLDSVWKNMRKKTEKTAEEFRKKTDRVSLLRTDISDRCAKFAEKERGICRLTVPTGGGKTISSLRFAVNYCRNFGMKKIIYVAPFMSILEQNSDVLRNAAGDENFLEHHSNIIANFDSKEETEEYERRCERWDDPVIATTAVQFLNTLFSGKASSVRRFHQLEKAVIIIDEIQSLPIKCVYLFNLAMNFLSRICGSVIVLCSATQPALGDVEYPLLLDKEESITGDCSEDFKNFKRTEIISDIRPEQYTYEQAADYAYEKFTENNNLLMTVNTKSAAVNMFKLLKEKCEIYGGGTTVIHLSTFMCPAHRQEKLRLVRKLLDEKNPVICVTTQLIESGVDISFNCVVRSAAGADSIAQAAGRCNRHGNDSLRPVYVINIKDENLGGSLEQIKRGKDIFTALADNRKNDLLSNEAMTLYFQKLYGEYKSGGDRLKYPVKDGSVNSSLLELLSTNKNRLSMCRDKKAVCRRAQAFATAGQLFEVIDKNTSDVIVPYNDDAKSIILDLNSDIRPDKAVGLLRRAQKYSVGIYDSTFKNMLESKRIYKLNFGEIYALDESCFSDDFGIENDNVTLEALIY